MKSSYAALAVVGLALAGLWYAGGGAATNPQSVAAAEQVRVSEPLAHENLTVYFIHGPDLVADQKVATLQEALDAGWAVVNETENVNQLSVENRSTDYELFIQEGDIIKGGKQDRMIAVDLLLPPKSGVVPFPAHCVEQGRWTARGGEDVKKFSCSTKCAVGNSIKIANAYGQQGEVWKNVKDNQDKISMNVGVKINAAESESSFQLALENSAVVAKVAEYEKSLKSAGENGKNVVGVVFVVNGKMTGAEVYGSSVLFQKAWPKLLSSAAAEALAEKTDKPNAIAPTAREVEHFLACGGEQPVAPGGAANNDDQLIADLVRLLGVTEAEARGALRPMSQIRDGTSNGVAVSRGSGNGRGRGNGSGQEMYNDLSVDNTNSIQLQTPRAIPTPNAPFSGRSGSTRNVLVNGGGGNAQPQRGAIANRNDEVHDLLEVLQPIDNRPAAQLPANPAGNRLNVNRVDNAAGLVTESRDPTRQNAIIHKSYIKK